MAFRQKRTVFKYKSGFEDKVIEKLSELSIEHQYEALKITYVHKPSVYTPDLLLPNGIIIEAKGYWDSEDRLKMVLVKEQHPDLDIRMLFQKASKPIRKGSRTTYGDYCDKHGIKWAEGPMVPMEWIEEMGHEDDGKNKGRLEAVSKILHKKDKPPRKSVSKKGGIK